MTIELVLAVAGGILGWLGFLEKRLRDMTLSFERRLNEKNEINKVVQAELKEDIRRLEHKIDMLLSVALSESIHYKKESK